MTSWACCPSSKKHPRPRFPRRRQLPINGHFLLTAYCKIIIFRSLATRSPQTPSDRARKIKIRTYSGDDPDDADKHGNLDEPENSGLRVRMYAYRRMRECGHTLLHARIHALMCCMCMPLFVHTCVCVIVQGCACMYVCVFP